LTASDSTSSPTSDHPRPSRRQATRDAVAFCLQRPNLRRTTRIALVVGAVLTAINQGGVIASGHVTPATWARCALNFVVPFLVSNAGLLGARRDHGAP
jgi:hypothetical protein